MTNEIIINLIARDKATGEILSVADALKAISKGTKASSSEIKKLTKETKKAASGLATLTKSIGRIAFYRAIRSAIKTVTSGIREGIQNLTLYSAALNSLDASSANKTMSEFATVSLWVKNTVGSMLMPVLQSLVPVVDAVAEAFIWAINAVNQFIKAIQGSKMWTMALKYPVDYAEKLNGVGKAAKEAKKQVFGFDELNIFKDTSSSGRGSSPLLDYSSMFAEVEVNNKLEEIGASIRQHITGIQTFLGGMALAVGALLIVTGHYKWGFAALIAGAALEWGAAGFNWNSLGNTVQSKLENLITLTAPVLVALGALLAISGKVGLGIGMIIAGEAMFTGFGATGASNELSDQLQEKLGEIGALVSVATLAVGAVMAIFGGNPTTVMKGVALIVAGMAGVATSIAMSNHWLSDDISKNFAIIEDIVLDFTIVLGTILALTGHIGLGLGMLLGGLVMKSANAKNLSSDEIGEELRSKLAAIEDIVLGFQTVIGTILMFTGHPAMGAALVGSAVLTKFASGNWNEKSLHDYITGAFGDLQADVDENFKNIADSSADEFQDTWGSKIKKWAKTLNVTVPIKGEVNYTASGWGGGRAEGGFVESGQMFMARENGIPEFVGSFGNRTAVANNAQIVEGIASGVESAMDNTNSVILQMANAIVNAIADKQINTQVISDRDIYRSAERGRTLSGATVIS